MNAKKHRNELKIDILLRMSLSASILKELFLWEKQNILLFHTKSKPAASVCTHTHEQCKKLQIHFSPEKCLFQPVVFDRTSCQSQ